VTGAGLAPLPVQRPIPVWLGAQSPPAFRRVGRIADGWLPPVPPGPKLDEARAIVERAALDAGRDPTIIGMEGRVGLGTKTVAAVAEEVGLWAGTGASHVAVNTMGSGLRTVDDHLQALAEIAGAVGLVGT